MTRKQITSQYSKRGVHAVQEKPTQEAAEVPVPDHGDDLEEALRVAPAWAQKLFAVRQIQLLRLLLRPPDQTETSVAGGRTEMAVETEETGVRGQAAGLASSIGAINAFIVGQTNTQ